MADESEATYARDRRWSKGTDGCETPVPAATQPSIGVITGGGSPFLAGAPAATWIEGTSIAFSRIWSPRILRPLGMAPSSPLLVKNNAVSSLEKPNEGVNIVWAEGTTGQAGLCYFKEPGWNATAFGNNRNIVPGTFGNVANPSVSVGDDYVYHAAFVQDGLRVGEVALLRWEDVDLERGRIVIKRLKG